MSEQPFGCATWSLEKRIRDMNCQQLKSFLLKQKDFLTLTDDKGNSLPHLAVLHNSLQKLKLMIQYAKLKRLDVGTWLDIKNSKNVAPVHTACVNKQDEMLFLLVDQGAQIGSEFKGGLSIAHLAAKINCVVILDQLHRRGENMSPRDQHQSTPLHWAVYSLNIQAVEFYLSLNPDLSAKDKHGSTPLHIAALKNSSKLIRMLLIAGADPAVKNKDGKTAEQMFANAQLAKKIFGRDVGCLQRVVFYYNLKLPNKPVGKEVRLSLLFILLLTLLNCATLISVKISQPLFYGQLAVAVALLIMFLRLLLFGPECLQPTPRADYINELRLRQQNVCFVCRTIVTERSKHCQICNRCVRVYDHHCPWINNCVGKSNLKAFLLFLLLILANCGIQSYVLVLGYTNMKIWPTTYDRLIPEDLKEPLKYVIQIVCSLFTLLYTIFVTAILVVQINNLSYNKTTYERYSRRATAKPAEKTADEAADEQLLQKQLAKEGRSCKNVLILCCQPEGDY